MQKIWSSAPNNSQQPSSLQGTAQLVAVLEFMGLTQPKAVLYADSSSFSNNFASCFVSNLVSSLKNVNPSVPTRLSGFSMSLQIVKLESAGGMISADELLLETTNPDAMAAAITLMVTVTAVVVEVAGSIPNGPTGAAAAAVPPALTPAAHDDAAF